LQDKFGDLLLTAAIKIADRELAMREPRAKAKQQQADHESELLTSIEAATGARE
jgi:hypothetical protein